MKSGKLLKTLYVGGIVAVCALPLLLSPLAGGSSSEKRALASFPSVLKNGELNLQFFAGVDDWIADHFAGRSWMITANNTLKSAVFGSSDEDKVIVGQDGWLYFAETAADFLGTNPLSETELSQLSVTLDLMAEYVSSTGGTFVFAVAPNKNSVYPERMPYYYRPSDKPSNLDRLTDRLADRSYYLDLKTPLCEGGEDLYHARDSHWNALGARLGYAKLMEKAGRDVPDYADTPYHFESIWEGDLDGMIFPSAGVLDKQAVFSFEETFVYTSNFHGVDDLTITTENEEASGKLLCFRDSFGNALLPFLAQNYGEATFSRLVPYSLVSLAEDPCDTVILEVVERNIRNLLSATPVMPAPTRSEGGRTAVKADCTITPKNGMILVEGTLEQAAGRVYLSVTTPDGEMTVVEAFPFAGGTDTPSFSAYLPASYADCEIGVTVN